MDLLNGAALKMHGMRRRDWVKLAPLLCIVFAAPCLIFFGIFAAHGSDAFNHEFPRLALGQVEWQNLLDAKPLLMVGGPHFGGEALVWSLLKTDSRFLSQQKFKGFSGQESDEGIFFQDVYPRFALAKLDMQRQIRVKANMRQAGYGRYALANEAGVHWTEGHDSVTLPNKLRLLNSFGYLWGADALQGDFKVLLEHSAPNVVHARFLQALLNIDVNVWTAPSQPPDWSTATASSRVKFLFVTQHPLANALEHKRRPECRAAPLGTLVANWLRIHEYAAADAPFLQHKLLVKFEDVAAKPREVLSDIHGFVGLEADVGVAAPDAPAAFDPNARIRDEYCANLRHDKRLAKEHAAMVDQLEARILKLGIEGYDLSGSWPCIQAALDQAHTESEEL
ncbi:hypothetical protein M885DRAFT_509309 [Pelagophyceae sp. CCMP2097]|nr:hypothetical protein M885DRAFT_509309 [Pelagophyceae sp. CCMP2097]